MNSDAQKETTKKRETQGFWNAFDPEMKVAELDECLRRGGLEILSKANGDYIIRRKTNER
jgi:hypothetical protein